MSKVLRNKKGITLVTLVITIILLLILAGVSIRTLGGENGLITKTKIAKEENLKSEYKEKLSIAKTEAIVEKSGQDITLDEYIEQIKADKIEGIKSIEKITNDKASVITKEGYIFIITVNSIEYYENENTLPEMNIKDANIEFVFEPNTWTNKKVEVTVSKKENKYTIQLSKDTEKWATTNKMTFEENGEIYARLIDEIGRTSDVASRKITKIDKEKPVVTEAISNTNSVRIKATDDAAGIVGYAVTTSTTAPTSFTSCNSTKSLDVTVDGLTQGTTYYAWVKDAAGNVSEGKLTATGTVAELEIKVNTISWTTSKTITITAANSNYSNIRYTTDGTIPTSTTGTAISSGGTFTITSNCTITAVAFDSTGQAGIVATNKITTIDRTAPTTATLSAGTINSAKSIVLTASGTDNESGIKEYEIYVNGSKVSSTNTYTITNMPFNTTYSCYTIVKNAAGNPKQSTTITVKNEAYISTVTDLKNLAAAVNGGNNFNGKTITQTSDINLGCSSSNQWTPIGNGGAVFSGTYDGNHKNISNIYINTSTNRVGLFGYCSGTIKNVNLTSGSIKGYIYVGGITSLLTGKVENCSNATNLSVLLKGTEATEGNGHIGGIVGVNYGTVQRCFNSGTISVDIGVNTVANSAMGGITGYNNNNAIINSCYNKGKIAGNATNVAFVGGIAGSGANIQNCYNYGNVSTACAMKYIGGIVGSQHVVTNSYYLNTCGATGAGTSKTSAQLKALTSTLGNGFKADSKNINGGYPILEWQ